MNHSECLTDRATYWWPAHELRTIQVTPGVLGNCRPKSVSFGFRMREELRTGTARIMNVTWHRLFGLDQREIAVDTTSDTLVHTHVK